MGTIDQQEELLRESKRYLHHMGAFFHYYMGHITRKPVFGVLIIQIKNWGVVQLCIKISSMVRVIRYMGLNNRKPDFVICEQQRCRPACTYPRSGQCLPCSLSGKSHYLTCSIQTFNILASFCRRADWFESHLPCHATKT